MSQVIFEVGDRIELYDDSSLHGLTIMGMDDLAGKIVEKKEGRKWVMKTDSGRELEVQEEWFHLS